MSQITNAQRHISLTDTIIVACSTILAYLYAFNFEYGIAKTFNISNELIEVSLSTAIFAWSGFISFFPFIIIIGKFIIPIIEELPNPILMTLVDFILSVAFFSFLLTTLNIWHFWWYSAGFIMLIFMIRLIIPLINSRQEKKKYLTALDESINKASQSSKLYKTFNDLTGIWGKALIALILLCYVGSFYLGVLYADVNTKYLIRNSNPEMVVLRIYGDKMICASFNRTKKEVQTNFFILKASEDSRTSFKIENIGPLHIATK